MKCICGYEHEEKYNHDKKFFEIVKGHDKFIRVNVVATVKREARWGREASPYCSPDSEVSFYACPECNTIKIVL